jgi:tRNA (guanine6-N2)-methyltransferase
MPRTRRSKPGANAWPSPARRSERPPEPLGPGQRYEAEVLPGLAPFALAELKRLGARVFGAEEDRVPFEYRGPLTDLLSLRRCVAVYMVLHFDVPRPKALLGHAHFSRLIRAIEELRGGPAGRRFNGFRIGAAGSGSPVFARLGSELSSATGLAHLPEEGELLLRVRPRRDGWEVLVRTTERPLSARAWRICNIPGGLNATVAAATHDLLGRAESDRYLNLMCGSGTLLVERAAAGAWGRGVGVDIDEQALACTRRNVAAAGLGQRVELMLADAAALPFPNGAFDRLTADLPWGDAVGNSLDNARLYPRFLQEAARVAAPGARLAVITHELRLLEATMAREAGWRQEELVRVFHGGHRPGIFVLRWAG